MKLISPHFPMRLCIVLCINIYIINILNTQKTSICPIGVPMEPKIKSEVRSASIYKEISEGTTPLWKDLVFIKFSDDHKAEMTLNGISRSRQIRGNNFKFQIPDGATINGIMLMVEGQSQNFKNMDEVEIYLLGKDAEPKGENKRNQAKAQKAWSHKVDGTDHAWMYGAAGDTWGKKWTAAEINDPNFGFQIQLRNIDNGSNKVIIDQVTILVSYTPAYSFCDDNCLTFYIDEFESYGSYVWEQVKGFKLVSHTYNHQTIDLKSNDAPYGLYNICVNVYDKSGNFVDRCCRDFLYQDCFSSEIKGHVWADLNDDDLQDEGDRFIPGLPVYLFTKENTPVDTAITDATGAYHFTMQSPGTYYIKASNLADHKFVLFDPVDPDHNSDITNVNGSGTTALINVEIGRKYEDIGLGYKPLVTIGDLVWEDINFNGLQGSLEKGLGGMTVQLLRRDSSIADSVITDQSGRFLFKNVHANTYQIKIVDLKGFLPTWYNATDLNLNSKIDSVGLTALTAFTEAGSRLNIDAGLYKKANIGDFVWEDINANGLFEPDEPGLPNMKLTLSGISGDGRPITREVFSDLNGNYYFENLFPGVYNINLHASELWHFTISNAGNDSLDSDALNGQIHHIILSSNDHLLAYDFGLYKTAEMGDYVWNDKNANGIQDLNETGISGVTLTLTKISSNGPSIVKSIVTDDHGKYLFDTLIPGSYLLKIIQPEGYEFTAADQGHDDAIDSDYHPYVGINKVLKSGESILDSDIGLFEYSQIGDFVWEDKNTNGIQDVLEPGIQSIIVSLTGTDGLGDSVTKQVTTDASGFYVFGNLKPGNYHLSLSDQGENYVYTLANSGSDDSKDSDAIQGKISDILLEGGQNNRSFDFGLVKYGQIGDFVWEDQNTDGIQGTTEKPIAGVEVRLYGTAFDNSVLDKSITTDAAGKYTFSKILPGSYTIGIAIPTGFIPTKYKIGNDRNSDSNLHEDGSPSRLEIAESTNDLSVDFGLIKMSSIGGFVWDDLNGDGVKQADEPNLIGAYIALTGKDIFNVEVRKWKVSDILGFYLFNDLKPGAYTITFYAPQAYESDLPLVKSVSLDPGIHIRNLDSPFFKRTSLGDYVWDDLNGNGIQEAGEPGISGVSVTLTSITDHTFGSQTTSSDASGAYHFGNLKPGTYRLLFGDVADFRFTTRSVGTDIHKDNDVDSGGQTSDIIILSGTPRGDIDAGYRSTSTTKIGDQVWEDMNGNGLQDTGEVGIARVQVSLTGTSSSGKLIAQTTTTDQQGIYAFDSLPDGRYKILFMRPQGFVFTHNVNHDDNRNSDADADTGTTSEIVLGQGQIITSIDAGMYRLTSLGDYVWDDLNGNGIQEAGEPGISGVSVTLSKASDGTFKPIGTTTNEIGFYKFDNLAPGIYNLQFGSVALKEYTVSEQGTDQTKDSNTDSSGLVSDIILMSGTNRTDIDAGYILVTPMDGRISGVVWQDNNNNKYRDGADLLLTGIEIRLHKMDNTIVATTSSGSDGSYSFNQVTMGDYYVSTTQFTDKSFVVKQLIPFQSGSLITNKYGSGTTDMISLLPGATVSNIDLGYFKKITIGDLVWDDQNNNGLQDLNEPGLADITVMLINEAGETEKITISENSGHYNFSEIGFGRYKIKFSPKPGYLFSNTNLTDNTKNSKANPETGETELLDFFAQTSFDNIDAGYIKSGMVGSRVWLDVNGNGLFQSNEPGVQNIKVILYSANGLATDSTITNLDATSAFVGFYTIKNIRPGTYYLKFEIPDTYLVSPSNFGIDDNIDNDITNKFGANTTDEFTIVLGQFIKNMDAGIYKPATIGDRVWNDQNKNGIQDQGEPGVGNVTVRLYNQSGALLETSTTNGQGIYHFKNLKQRIYYLQFILPDGFQFTGQNTSGANHNDSDVDPSGITPLISLSHGSTLLEIDAGIYITNARIIIGSVWKDKNEDGIHNIDESYESGVTVHLQGRNRSDVTSTLTNHAGRYTFITEQTGEHIVAVEPPSNHAFTKKGMGGNPDFDSDVDEYGISDGIMLYDTYFLKYIDAGYIQKLNINISGKIWKDKNQNNLWETTDSFMQDIVVFLYDKSGYFIKSTKSDDTGHYAFKNLDSGQYYCRLPILNDLDFVFYTGNNLDNDSEITNQYGLGTSRLITVQKENVLENVDFGYKDLSKRLFVSPNLLQQYNVFPNPAVNDIRVKIPDTNGTVVQYFIVDNQGKIVKAGQVDDQMDILETGHLPSGRYTLTFINNNEKIIKSFIKIDN